MAKERVALGLSEAHVHHRPESRDPSSPPDTLPTSLFFEAALELRTEATRWCPYSNWVEEQSSRTTIRPSLFSVSTVLAPDLWHGHPTFAEQSPKIVGSHGPGKQESEFVPRGITELKGKCRFCLVSDHGGRPDQLIHHLGN